MSEKEFMEIIAKRIKLLRKLKDMSKRELEIKSGVGKSTVFKIEAGTANPNIGTLYKIAKGLDIELYILFQKVEVKL